MTERSAKWLEKRSYLDQKEEKVKNELSEASGTLEVGVKKVIAATAVVGASVATAYMIYRAFSKKKKKPEPEIVYVDKPVEANVKARRPRRKSIKSVLLERLALVLVQVISSQLTLLLSKNKAEKTADAKVKEELDVD